MRKLLKIILVLVIIFITYNLLGFYFGIAVTDYGKKADGLVTEFQKNLISKELDPNDLNREDLSSCHASGETTCSFKITGVFYTFKNKLWQVRQVLTGDNDKKYQIIWMGDDKVDQIETDYSVSAAHPDYGNSYITNNVYFSDPYLLLEIHDYKKLDNIPRILVYNTNTKKETIITDPRAPGCKNASIIDFAYENGVLYFGQFQEWWPLCTGDFKMKLDLN